jgi:amino acid permease
VDSDWEDLFSVDEIMGGLPARRASMVLFAIEGRTGQLVSRSRRALALDFSGRTSEQEEQQFLQALSEGAALPIEPSIQDLERYAPDWKSLVPDDPSVRAALAKLFAEKYRISASRTPQLQDALRIDDDSVSKRYEDLYGVSITSIFARDLTWRERITWLKSAFATKLENLSPFWTAYALTLTATVGAGVLALPIAFAEIGVLGALLVLLVLGVANVLTIAAMSEAVARNGDIRYGRAYFGRLVSEYLGKPGLLILGPAIAVLYSISMVSYAIGISSTLSDGVGLSPLIWLALLLVVILLFLRRGSLSATVATAMMIGICTIGLLLLISLLAIPSITSDNLQHSQIPLVDGNAFDAGTVGLIFGVALLALFGHTATVNCAATVLQQDPTARSLIRGATAALVTATILYMVWIFAVNGAVSSEILKGEQGTALAPLAEIAGPSVTVLGMMFVILAMGMASVQLGWGLANLVGEWLPPAGQTESDSRALSALAKWRQAITLTPMLAIFFLVAVLFAIGQESFTGPLGFLGVVTVPLISGIFAMLMLAVARRKGDCAVESGWRFLGNRIVVAVICIFFLAAVLLHGLVIWTQPLQRAVAVGVSICMVVFMIVSVRNSFVPRSVAEVRYPEEGPSLEPDVSVVARGKTMAEAHHELMAHGGSGNGNFRRNETWSVDIRIPATPVREMKVWVHQRTGDGSTSPLPAIVRLNGNEPFQLYGATGKIVIPVDGSSQHVVITPSNGNSSLNST